MRNYYTCEDILNTTIGSLGAILPKNNKTCMSEFVNAPDEYCPAVFDNRLCWPPTEPNCTVRQPCPQLKHTISYEYAYRNCMEDGQWERKGSKGYTHYERCFPEGFWALLKMCMTIGADECKQITYRTRVIELVGLSLSLVSLVISLLIFFQYRVLKNNRTKIHMNLFVAIVLQVIMRLITYSTPDLDENPFHLCRVPSVLLEYAKTAMFIWMFIEGLYLHNMITVTVFQEYLYIKLYFYVGWILPALLTLTWLIVMICTTEKCWNLYSLMSYYWILEGPRSAVIVVNMMFLLNIIRVLVVKLRQSQTREIVQVRKAVRAAVFLLPLMGISNLLYLVDFRCFEKAWKYALWCYTTHFLNTFQGFFVAILYCFLNGEVRAAIKNSIYVYLSLWNHNYVPCRNATVVSTAVEPINNPTNCCEFNHSHTCYLSDGHKTRSFGAISESAQSQKYRDNWNFCCVPVRSKVVECEIRETKV